MCQAAQIVWWSGLRKAVIGKVQIGLPCNLSSKRCDYKIPKTEKKIKYPSQNISVMNFRDFTGKL